jgi:hypothetical protein
MATDLGMSFAAPSTFLSSKTLSCESNKTFKKTPKQVAAATSANDRAIREMFTDRSYPAPGT